MAGIFGQNSAIIKADSPPKPAADISVDPMPQVSQQRVGVFYGLLAYLAWGLLPIYFHLLATLPALGVFGHRILWTMSSLALLVSVRRNWPDVMRVLRSRRTVGLLAVSAFLLGNNWFFFIYAIATRQVLQSSLAYFINPLLSVLLGMIFLGERLRRGQWIAVGVAAAGVIYLTVAGGVFPWISLLLATVFGLYGLIRKVLGVGPVTGLLIETIWLSPVAVGLIMAHDAQVVGAMPARMWMLISISGVLTAFPLIFFVAAAQRLRLATMGFLQYLTPTLQFCVAVFLFGEPLRPQMLVAFAMIWTALLIYSIDSIRSHRTRQVIALVE